MGRRPFKHSPKTAEHWTQPKDTRSHERRCKPRAEEQSTRTATLHAPADVMNSAVYARPIIVHTRTITNGRAGSMRACASRAALPSPSLGSAIFPLCPHLYRPAHAPRPGAPIPGRPHPAPAPAPPQHRTRQVAYSQALPASLRAAPLLDLSHHAHIPVCCPPAPAPSYHSRPNHAPPLERTHEMRRAR